MATYQISKHAGKTFYVHRSRAGTPLVMNGKNGKAKVAIPCKDDKMAEKVIQMLSADHGGEIRI